MKSFLHRRGAARTAKLSWRSQLVLFAASVIFAPTPLLAHVPFLAKDNVSLETAFHVKEPAKSWVTSGELHGEQDARWFTFDCHSGDPIVLELFVSPDAAQDFVPKLAVAGPGVSPSGSLPPSINLHGMATAVYSGVRDEEPDFEPFTPTRLYFVLHVDTTAPASGLYYVLVFSERTGGKFGLVIGSSESFTPVEWISIPIAVIGTYCWEGQSLAFVFLPFAAILFVGACILFFHVRKKRCHWGALLGMLAGITFLGSATLYSTQVMPKAFSSRSTELWLWFVPPVIVAAQILLGIGVIRSAAKSRPVRTGIYGALGLFAWAGYIIGPMIAIASAIAIAIRNRSTR